MFRFCSVVLVFSASLTASAQTPLPTTPATQQPGAAQPAMPQPATTQPGGSPAPIDPTAPTAAAPPSFAPETDGEAPTPRGPVRISGGVMAGYVIHKATPVYPPQAGEPIQSSPVILSVLIGKTGTVQKVSVISGPAVRAKADMEAVKHWTYRPYMLNGEPVEVQTTVTITAKTASGSTAASKP